MRSILMSLLFILTVILIYSAVVEGDDGMNDGVARSGGAMSEYMKEMNP